MEKVKLSELPSKTKVGYEDSSCLFTAGQLREIVKNNEALASHTWYVFAENRWEPNAGAMIRQYLKSESEVLNEEWKGRALGCLNCVHYDRIQAVLDEAFSSDDATKYWMLDGRKVIIDTLDQPSA